MNTVVFTSEKVRSVPAYLEYFFLRFPGTLGPEESLDLEFFDTYDRRWTRDGKVWTQRNQEMSLVSPPSLLPFGPDESATFGLQKPIKVGRAVVKIRALTFDFPRAHPLQGEVVKGRSKTYLVIAGRESDEQKALTSALIADGWEPFVSESAVETLVHDRGPGFPGPTPWPKPRLQDPGIPFLLDRIAEEWRLARQYEKGVREDIDTECLHQYRVHLRRARSLAGLGKMWERVPEWLRLKTVLGDLQRETNELRDLDVLLLDFPGLQAQLPWGEGSHLEGWRSTLQRRRTAEWRRVKALLESEDYRQKGAEAALLLDDLRGLGEPWSVAELAISVFQKAVGGLHKSLKGLVSDSPDGALHEVRIRAKKLRYALDGFGSLASPQAVKTTAAILKGAQDGLGKFQDRSILLERLRVEWEVFRSGRAGLDALAFGLLVGILVSGHSEQKAMALADCRRLGSKTFTRALERLVEANPSEVADES